MNNKQTLLVGTLALLIGISGGMYGGVKLGTAKNFSGFFGDDDARGGYNQSHDGRMFGGQKHRNEFENTDAHRSASRSGIVRGGSIVGEVLAKDDTSITIKTPDGSSIVVFYGESTAVGTLSKAHKEDIATEQKVRVIGAENTDGSIAAQSIHIIQAQ